MPGPDYTPTFNINWNAPIGNWNSIPMYGGVGDYISSDPIDVNVSNKLVNGSSDSYYNQGGYKDCHVCHGSGRCQTCNGTGYVTNFGNTSECPNCQIEYGHRNGKCSVCHGKGKVFH